MMILEFNGTYRFLSNFYRLPTPIYWLDEGWWYAENAFQATKCLHEEDRAKFMDLSPGQAKRLGRHIDLRPDWDQIKLGVMEDVLLQKFDIPELRQMLLNTGLDELVEGNHWGDTYWGMILHQGKWIGHNNLGKILMEIRDSIRRGDRA